MRSDEFIQSFSTRWKVFETTHQQEQKTQNTVALGTPRSIVGEPFGKRPHGLIQLP